ncbi:hypothetical protein SCHPADRAFT_887678 [Schizopora paradoxa]|uniref:Uncharacterized protein n=1 Tax=Schizopora paradoxa TaxID=27342 RepID=A0A0H2RX31_9AGAM|nr:hypothetical protein SCHPADRAFT_887678 [Schizopora paradoxa]
MWSDKVIRQFATVPPNPSENDFLGQCNKLLSTLFPADSDFVVVPQFIPPDSPNAVDFLVLFEVMLVNKPVLILALRPPSHQDILSKRWEADYQVRMRMVDTVGQSPSDSNRLCPIDTLYGISALGTKLCFYTLDTKNANADIVPAAIARHPTRLNHVAPVD